MAVITHTDRGVEVLVAEGDGPRRLYVREVPDGAYVRATTDGIVLGPGAIDAVMEVLRRAKAGALDQGRIDHFVRRTVPTRGDTWHARQAVWWRLPLGGKIRWALRSWTPRRRT